MTQEDMATLVRNLHAAINEQSAQIGELQKMVKDQNAQVKRLTPKSRFWWLVAAFIGAGAILLLVRDNDLEQQERARQSDIAACERTNQVRRSLRETIEIAYRPRPVPPDLSPELVETFRLQEVDRAARRDSLLSQTGLQHVDCPAQYPK